MHRSAAHTAPSDQDGTVCGVADRAEAGQRYTVKNGVLSWNVHFNGQIVVALESYDSPNAEIEVQCECCGGTTHVSISDLS